MPTVLRSTLVGAGVAMLLALAAPAFSVAQQSSAAHPGAPTAGGSWTAAILYPVAARRAPSPRARIVTELNHYSHWSRGRHVLMVEGSFTEPGGRRWVRVRLAQRPNNKRAWVPRAAVQLRRTSLRLRVSIAHRTLEVYQSGRLQRRIRVAVGRPGAPTTTGLFSVADIVGVSGQLAPNLVLLTAYTRVAELRNFLGGDGLAAIHGWPDSSVFGRAVSSGCVRAAPADVAWLASVAKPGTPVVIAAR